MIAYGLLALLVVLHALDIWTTVRILKTGGVEHNKFMQGIFDKIGVISATLLMKGLSLIPAIYIAFWMPQYWWVLAVLCAVYVAVVLHNLDNI